jgi:hypothetical protein
MTFTFQSFQEYIKQLCIKHKVVDHQENVRQTFFRMDEVEQAYAQSSIAQSPYVKVDDAVGYFTGKGGQDAFEWSVVLQSLHRVDPTVGNLSDNIESARQVTLDILIDFYLRMMEDYENGDICDGIKTMNIRHPEFAPLGPEGQNEYGWLLRMTFSTNVPKYDASKWID